MNESEKKVIESLAQKLYNLSAEDAAVLYNAEGELSNVDIFLEKDAERVAKFKKARDDQYSRGLKEHGIKFESALKEKYELDSDLQGVELVDHLLEVRTAELTQKLEDQKKSKLKDDEFEKHPKFAALKLEHEKQLKAKDKEWEDKIKSIEAEQTKKETFSRISKLALLELDTEFVMPDKAERATVLKDVVLKELQADNYSFQEETPVILDKDGKPKEDPHGKLVNFKEYVHGIAGKYFDKKMADKRANAGNQGIKPDVSKDGQIVFNNRDEQTEAFRLLESENLTSEEKSAKRIKIKNALIKTK